MSQANYVQMNAIISDFARRGTDLPVGESPDHKTRINLSTTFLHTIN